MKAIQKVVERVALSNAFSFEDGAFRMMGITGMPFPLPSLVFHQELLEEVLGQKKAMDFIYTWGKIQAYHACRIMESKYGIKDKMKLTQAVMGQFPLVGAGIMTVKKIDYNMHKVILECKEVPFAKAYASITGKKNVSADHFVRGLCAGLFENIFKTEVTAIETACIVKGDPACLFEVQPTASIKRDEQEESQIPSEHFDFKKICDRIRPQHFFMDTR